jgi:nitroimidazol reductase NimA-like FMN-containing flavoprotein (pyridoxamine 5'-phosphate oxidase superfamily)
MMIPERHRMSRESALALLARADVVHVAGGGERIVLRPLHSVLLDEALAWHCSLRGEKDLMLGRVAEVCAHEKVAEIPSHFRDPENACPATTYYESVLGRGIPQEVTDPALKARLLQAIMEKYQPEGGHRPISHDDTLYRSALEGVKLVRMPLDEISGKSKLGQNLSAEMLAMVLEGLRRRGRPEDLAAIDRLITANPDAMPPDRSSRPDLPPEQGGQARPRICAFQVLNCRCVISGNCGFPYR